MNTAVLHHEYLWAYKSAKKGSVFKTITEIDRIKSIRLELLNFMFSLRYKSKPKRNITYRAKAADRRSQQAPPDQAEVCWKDWRKSPHSRSTKDPGKQRLRKTS